MIIELTWPEILLACQAGVARRLHHMERSSQGRWNQPGGLRIELDCMSCMYEVACAKGLNLWWTALQGIKAPDVGGWIEVRGTDRPNRCLLLHQDDPDGLPFVMVEALQLPRFRLCGWMFGREGKSELFWSDPLGNRPAYFVPQDRLHDMTALQNLIAGQNATALGGAAS